MTPDTLLPVLYAHQAGLLDLRAISIDRRWPPVQTFVPPADTEAITTFCTQHAGRELYFGVALRRDARSGALENCAQPDPLRDRAKAVA